MADIRFVIDVDGVEKVVRLRQETEKVAPAAKNAGDKLDKMSRKVAGYGNTTNGARKNTNRMNAAIQNAGYQFGDFFVQVQSGQNALVAFSQQGTQLLGILPGVAGAVGGLAVVLGTQLLMAIDRNVGIFETFSEKAEAAEASLDRFLATTKKVAKGFREELGPEVASFYNTLLERDTIQAIRDSDKALSGMLHRISELQRSIGKQEFKANVFYSLGLIGAQKEAEASLKQLQEFERQIQFLQGIDPTNIEDLQKGLKGIEQVLKSDIQRELDLSDKQLEKLRDLSVAWASALDQLTPEAEDTTDELEKQKELLEAITDLERERQRLGEGIDAVLTRSSLTMEGMERGLSKGVASQIASLRMRIDEERKVMAELYEAQQAAVGSEGFVASLRATDIEAQFQERMGQLKQFEQELLRQEEMSKVSRAKKKEEKESVRGGAPATRTEEEFMRNYHALRQYNLGMKELDSLSKDVSTSFVDMFRSITDGTKTATEAFRDMTLDIAKRILDLLIYQPMINALTNSLSSALGVPGMAMAGATRGGVIPFANGGVVGSPTYFGMSGGRTGLMGEAGPEAILPLKRGPGGKLGVEGGGNVTVNQSFNFAANGDESVKKIIAQAAPGIAKMTEAQIVNSRQRGGQMRRVFS